MSYAGRRIGKAALSLCVTTALTVGVGCGVASATSFDAAAQPIDLGQTQVGMTIEQSQYIARQLKPVPLKVTLKKGPRRPIPEWAKSSIKPNPFFDNDAWRYVRKGYKPGQVMRQRKARWVKGYFPIAARGVQYAYVSYDSRGYPMTATATLVIPHHLKPNASVMEYNQFINSSGPNCSVTTQMNQLFSWGMMTSTIQMVGAALALGYPVLLPDGDGANNIYAINRVASHVILDSMRMVHEQHDFPLVKSHFVSLGASHGGMMTGYTAAEQPYYAPDLTAYVNQFVVNEGAPDLIKLAHSFGLYGELQNAPSVYGSFLMSFVVGAAREYPDLLPHLYQWFTPYGKAVVKGNRSICTPLTFAVGPGVPIKNIVKEGFFASQTFKNMLQIAKYSSSFYYPGTPKVPTLLIHGTLDEILFQADQDKALWQRYCKAGSNVVYEQVPGTGHFITPAVSFPRMVIQSVKSLEGNHQTPNCSNPVIL